MVRLIPHELLILPHSRMKRSWAFVRFDDDALAISKKANFQKVREYPIIADELNLILVFTL